MDWCLPRLHGTIIVYTVAANKLLRSGELIFLGWTVAHNTLSGNQWLCTGRDRQGMLSLLRLRFSR